MANPYHALAQKLEKVSADVKKLGRTPQLTNSSLEDGAIEEYDAAGNLTQIIGKQFDGTHGAVVVSGPVPPTPSAPALTGGLGLTGGWDGLFADESGAPDITIPAPMDWARAEFHISRTPGFIADTADTLAGTIETPRGGGISILVEPGTWYAVLVARSTSGKRSAQSAESTAVVALPAGAEVDVEALRAEFTAAQEDLQESLRANEAVQAALGVTVSTLRDTTIPALEEELGAAGERLDAADQLLNVTFPKRLTDAEATAGAAASRAAAAETAAAKAAADLVTAKASAATAAANAASAAAEADAAEASATRATGAAGVAETAADKAAKDAAAALVQAQSAGGNVTTAQAAATAAQAAADTAKAQATTAGTSAAAADAKAAQAAADAAKAAADAVKAQASATTSATEAATAKAQATASATKATEAETAAAAAKTRADTAAADAAAAATRAATAEASATRATGAAGTAETAANKSAQDAAAALTQAQSAGSNATAAQTAAAAAKTASDAAKAAAATAGTSAAAADSAAAAAAATAAQAAADLIVARNAAADARGDANTALARADSALTMAGSASRVLYSTGNPSGTAREGDTWRKTASDVGNVIGEWRYTKNSAGALAWRAQQVTTDMISNLDVGKLTAGTANLQTAVVTKLVANLAAFVKADIGNLTVTGESQLNTVTAQRIAAGVATFLSITTDQLVAGTAQLGEAVAKKFAAETGAFMKLTANQVYIGEAGNMERDPTFEQLDGWHPDNIPPTINRHAGGGYNGATAMSFPLPLDPTKISGAWRYNPDGRFSFPVVAGEKYRISCWVQSDKDMPIQSAVMHMRASTPDGGFWGVPVLESAQNGVPLKAGQWHKITEVVTIPANATSAFLGYFRFVRAATAIIRFSTPTVQQAITPSLIVDGFFQGLRVIGASVETNEAPETGVKMNDKGTTTYGKSTVNFSGVAKAYKVRANVDSRINQWGVNATASLPGFWLESEPADGSSLAPQFPAGLTLTDSSARAARVRSAMGAILDPYSEVMVSPTEARLESYAQGTTAGQPRGAVSAVTVSPTQFNLGTVDAGFKPQAQVQHLGDGILRLNAAKGVQVNGVPLGEAEKGPSTEIALSNGFTHYMAAGWAGIRSSYSGNVVQVSGAYSKGSYGTQEVIATLPRELWPPSKVKGENVEINAGGQVLTVVAGSGPQSIGITYLR